MNVDKNKSDISSLSYRQLPALVIVLLLTFSSNIVCAQTEQVYKPWPAELETLLKKYAGVFNENALTELVEMINKTH